MKVTFLSTYSWMKWVLQMGSWNMEYNLSIDVQWGRDTSWKWPLSWLWFFWDFFFGGDPLCIQSSLLSLFLCFLCNCLQILLFQTSISIFDKLFRDKSPILGTLTLLQWVQCHYQSDIWNYSNSDFEVSHVIISCISFLWLQT